MSCGNTALLGQLLCKSYKLITITRNFVENKLITVINYLWKQVSFTDYYYYCNKNNYICDYSTQTDIIAC